MFDVGLNIAEAHVFCTSDGFVLDVFVAQGWRENDAKGLEAMLQSTFDQFELAMVTVSSRKTTTTKKKRRRGGFCTGASEKKNQKM